MGSSLSIKNDTEHPIAVQVGPNFQVLLWILGIPAGVMFFQAFVGLAIIGAAVGAPALMATAPLVAILLAAGVGAAASASGIVVDVATRINAFAVDKLVIGPDSRTLHDLRNKTRSQVHACLEKEGYEIVQPGHSSTPKHGSLSLLLKAHLVQVADHREGDRLGLISRACHFDVWTAPLANQMHAYSVRDKEREWAGYENGRGLWATQSNASFAFAVHGTLTPEEDAAVVAIAQSARKQLQEHASNAVAAFESDGHSSGGVGILPVCGMPAAAASFSSFSSSDGEEDEAEQQGPHHQAGFVCIQAPACKVTVEMENEAQKLDQMEKEVQASLVF